VNGFDALAAIGAEARVKKLGFATTRTCYANRAGKRLGVMPAGSNPATLRTTRILRGGDLYQALKGLAVQRGALFDWTRALVDAHTDDDHVVVTMSDGSTERGDLLIGADGLYSRVRHLIDPGAPRPRATGFGCVFGLTRIPELTPDNGDLHSIFSKRGWFNYTVSPDGETWWSAYPIMDDLLARQNDQPLETERIRTRLLSSFGRDEGPAGELIGATEHDLKLSAQYNLAQVPVWSQGRMVIIGDAAHALLPSTGQSVAQLFESAAVLAQCLRDVGELTRALEYYESIRRKRIDRLLIKGRHTDPNNEGFIAKALQRVVFRLMLSKVSAPGGLDPMEWLMSHHIEWGRRVGT
jgi:2-polyprenyl-6-methoxyphenol hydroxylase-like FAD-dependent oxidoreductase